MILTCDNDMLYYMLRYNNIITIIFIYNLIQFYTLDIK